MQKTNIQYLTHSWNPVKMLCTPVSEGCRNCWAIQRAKMLANNPSIYADHQRAYKGGSPVLDYKELEAPLHKREPAKIGTMFMGDILHDSIDGFWISAIWGVMQRCPQHEFFLLTKRPERFLKLTPPLPVLENVWIGVSVSGPVDFWMVEILLQIQSAHYWISHEPGLGMVTYPKEFLALGEKALLVTGGETGGRARPMHPDIPKYDRDQCQSAGVKFFFKSWGEYRPPTGYAEWSLSEKKKIRLPDRKAMIKAKSRFLDNREWNEMP